MEQISDKVWTGPGPRHELLQLFNKITERNRVLLETLGPSRKDLEAENELLRFMLEEQACP